MMKTKLPMFGVGPLYGIIIFLLKLIFSILIITKVITVGNITFTAGKYLFIIMGIILVIYGFIIWYLSALSKKSITKYIKNNELCTTGIYSIVRNPCYTGISFFLTGITFFLCNYLIVLLFFFDWIFLTILMKFTEEKWLEKEFKDDYIKYKKEVSRFIPIFKISK